MSSSESEPRSPASAISSLTSTDLDSPMSPDGEFSQDFPPSRRDHEPEETVPVPGDEARFRGRGNQAAVQLQVQGGPNPGVAPPPQPNPPPPPPQDPAPEGLPALIIQPGLSRGARRAVAMGDPLPGPPLTPRAQTPENA